MGNEMLSEMIANYCHNNKQLKGSDSAANLDYMRKLTYFFDILSKHYRGQKVLEIQGDSAVQGVVKKEGNLCLLVFGEKPDSKNLHLCMETDPTYLDTESGEWKPLYNAGFVFSPAYIHSEDFIQPMQGFDDFYLTADPPKVPGRPPKRALNLYVGNDIVSFIINSIKLENGAVVRVDQQPQT